MKAMTVGCSALALALVYGGTVQAALLDRGAGLIYDTVLDVTWLQDAGLAAGSAFDDGALSNDGLMTWDSAMAWAADLSYFDSVRGVTYSDWRLPSVTPVNGVAFNYSFANDGSTDDGFNISAPGSAFPASPASELAFMYYTHLGNLGFNDVAGNPHPPNTVGLLNVGPFLRLTATGYWSGTENSQDASRAFNLFNYGRQDPVLGKGDALAAWAVRDGDVAAPVPVPAALWLFASAVAGLLALGRRDAQRA